MSSRPEKVARFRSLHDRIFLVGNPWDAGSARMLESLGYEALATSSGASAGVYGRRDGRITREESLAQIAAMVAAVGIPVSADLENCFGDAPEEVASTIGLAARTGLAGGSVEDATGRKDAPIYPFGLAVERVAAAAAAARKEDFVLTARCENFLRGNPDLDDTIRRLQAYEKAGADVLMAPGLPDLDAVRAVCKALGKPFSFMAGIRGKSWPVAELEAAGVKRVSVATSFYRAAMTGLVAAAQEALGRGTWSYLDGTMTTPELNKHFPDE